MLLLVSASLFCCTGCATLYHGSLQTVNINSNPGNGNVYINGELAGVTPVELSMKRDQDYMVRIEKEGYKPVEVVLEHSQSSAFYLNMLVLPLGFLDPKYLIFAVPMNILSMGLDRLKGGAYVLSHDRIDIDLDRAASVK